MMRHLGLVLCGCLVASLCSFFQPFCKPAFCESAKDSMSKGKEAYQAAKYEEAMNYYSKAIEMDPKLFKKQEEWVREKLRSGKTADLLERIDVILRDDKSLPMRKDLIEKYDKELMIRALFLQTLIADELNDAKAYRKGLTIKNAIVIGNLDLSKAEISPWVTISNCIFIGEVDLSHSLFQRGLNLAESHFLQAVKADSMKVKRSALFNKAVFEGAVDFAETHTERDFQADGARFECKAQATFNSLMVGQCAVFTGAVF